MSGQPRERGLTGLVACYALNQEQISELVVQILAPYAHWDIPVIGQSYLLFRARLVAPHSFSPGLESLETELFEPKDIPFDMVCTHVYAGGSGSSAHSPDLRSCCAGNTRVSTVSHAPYTCFGRSARGLQKRRLFQGVLATPVSSWGASVRACAADRELTQASSHRALDISMHK